MPQKDERGQRDIILIADDHEIFRAGLAEVLRASLGARRVIGAGRFDEALERLDEPELMLAIFDLGIPGLDTVSDLAQVRRRRPDIHVVVLSGSTAREDILAALEAGVHGYLIKSERTEDLVRRLKQIIAGEIYVPPIVAQLPPAVRNGNGGAAASTHRLTSRQRQVLELIAEGLPNKAIAERMGLSEGTVKMHVAATFRAIGASNRAHAAIIGRQFLA